MNCLHINTEMTWRGGERQAILLLQGLIDRGWTGGLCAHPDSAVARRAVRQNLPFFPVKLKGPLDILSAKRIARIARASAFDILHLHTAHACALGPWVRRFNPKVKLVASRRVGFPIRSFGKYRKMNAIVAVSSTIKDMLFQKRIAEDKIFLIHDGVPLPDMPLLKDREIIEAFRLANAFPVIGTIAHLAESKGHRFLLDAAKLLEECLPKARYLIIGEGEWRKPLEEQALNLNMLDHVVFTGFQKDVDRFLTVLDIFVLPSLMEGLGSSLLDAMAHGVPVIAAETGGIPDIIQSGENGLLVPPADPSALADAIQRLAGDDGRRAAIGKAGRATVEKKFSVRSMVEKTIALYNSLL